MPHRIRLSVATLLVALCVLGTAAPVTAGPPGRSSDISGTWKVTINCGKHVCFPGAKYKKVTSLVVLRKAFNPVSGATYFVGTASKKEHVAAASESRVVLVHVRAVYLMHTVACSGRLRRHGASLVGSGFMAHPIGGTLFVGAFTMTWRYVSKRTTASAASSSGTLAPERSFLPMAAPTTHLDMPADTHAPVGC